MINRCFEIAYYLEF